MSVSKDKPKKRKPRAKKPIKKPVEENLLKQVNTRCLTCQHEALGEINALLIEGVPNTEIGRRYNIPTNSVQRHRVNHLSPAIRQAEIESQRQLSLEVQTFTDETYLSALDKVKLMQERILNDLDRSDKLAQKDKNGLYSAWLSYLNVEAKLLNLYEPDKTLALDGIHKRIALMAKRQIQQETNTEYETQEPHYSTHTESDIHSSNDPEIANSEGDHSGDFQNPPPKPNPAPETPINIARYEEIVEQLCFGFNFIYGQDLAKPLEVVALLSR